LGHVLQGLQIVQNEANVKSFIVSRVLSCTMVCGVTPVLADIIPLLFNPGVDDTGTPLTNIVGDTDPHYIVTAASPKRGDILQCRLFG
jgi:hypothetical protein